MSKLPEPDFVTKWRAWVDAGPPKCCHTCEHYMQDGRCYIYDAPPPPEFIQTTDNCDKWIHQIPF
jgi:hypothetical protein